ncbi:MAG: hypothetical protein O3C27_01050 [Actinomycetota bacterium]|nr:hypothetical protein [Actinomycetota bacterium]
MRTRRGRAPLFVFGWLLFAATVVMHPAAPPAHAAVTEDTGIATPSPRDFVTLRYRDFLAREPDGPGLAF